MENPLKKFLSLFFKSNTQESQKEEATDKDILVVNKNSNLYNMINKKMTEAEQHDLTARKLQDLERAVYSLSSRVNSLTESIEKHTEFIVHLSTAYEEVANSFENENRQAASGDTESRKKSTGEDLEVYLAGKNKGKPELN